MGLEIIRRFANQLGLREPDRRLGRWNNLRPHRRQMALHIGICVDADYTT
jgi:hypothetical protein